MHNSPALQATRSRYSLLHSCVVGAVAIGLITSPSRLDVSRLDPPEMAVATDLSRSSESSVVRVEQPRADAATTTIASLASILADRYRISKEATLEFVHFAFGEGSRFGVDPLLILSVMAVESRFNPVAESNAGALGLMQIIPRFHSEKYDTNDQSLLDPETNIHVGVKILREYIARESSQVAALQRYNGAYDDPTTAYANKVLGEKNWLQRALKRMDRLPAA